MPATPDKPTTGPEMFTALRDQLFASDDRALLGAPAAGPDDVLGVVVEIGMSTGTALVFGLRDGTASIYLSGGGGTIGGQGRANVAAAAKRLVETAQALVAKVPPDAEHPLPAAGRIRFSLLTPAGVRAAEIAEPDVLEATNELRPLFIGANQIITGLRLSEEGAKPNEGLYMNLLLTALARGHAASVTLTAGERLPEPATLTNDAEDLDWFASMALDVGVQSSEKTINLVLEAAGFRRFHLRRTEGQIRTSLHANDGSGASDFDFKVTKSRTEGGRVRIEIAPVRRGG